MLSLPTNSGPRRTVPPRMNDHIVHVHRDREFLLESLEEYFRAGWARGEAVIVIARPALREALVERFGVRDDLRMLDAADTLARFMRDGLPQWSAFHSAVGGLIAETRCRYAGVCAYGEMVDILWQAGEQDAAIRLEEFWNELGRLQTFSLFCAYGLDSLEQGAALERICKVHTRFIPARDHSIIDRAVADASEEMLEQPLSRMLQELAARHGADMPIGHATLLWLERNMPRTAERVLARVREAVTAKAAA